MFKPVKFWQLIIFVSILVFAFAKINSDNKRLSDNIGAILKGTEYYRINDSISAARSERIILDNAEIKAYFPEIKKTISQMDVKLRQLERYSAISSTANYEIVSPLNPPKGDLQSHVSGESPPLGDLGGSIQYTSYKDKWINFQQAIVADSAYTSIQTRDSIAIVQSWKRPHKFLFLHWGRKRHLQTVTNANPHATITYSIFVEKNP